MDKIFIKNLSLNCIIGINPAEREAPQNIVVHVTLECDLRQPGVTDRIEHTVDYAALRSKLVAAIETSRFHLIEALAEHVAGLCLREPPVKAVSVLVEKPGIIADAGIMAVEIRRER